jgi:two-component system response regulator PilR (NtrC family)
VEAHRFREDLYYRLNVIGIHLPALRERRDDIPLLVSSILKRIVSEDEQPGISSDALELVQNYSYPGNVRELENILERAAVLGGAFILPEHLPETVRGQEVSSQNSQETVIIEDPNLNLPIDLDRILASIERRYIEQALVQTEGAKKKAANLLGINFRSFRYRLQKFGLSSESSSESVEQ